MIIGQNIYIYKIEDVKKDSYSAKRFLAPERLKLFKRARSLARKNEILSSALLINYYLTCCLKLKERQFILEQERITRRAIALVRRGKKVHKIFLNISHSKTCIALFSSLNKTSAVDIEDIREVDEKIYKRALCKNELEEMEKLKYKKDRDILFLQFWTQKECYFKSQRKLLLPFSKIDATKLQNCETGIIKKFNIVYSII